MTTMTTTTNMTSMMMTTMSKMNNNNNNNNPWQQGGGMEELLVHCAKAIESNDVTVAQQMLWVLNNTAPPDGDANQRLACGFLRALISRAALTAAADPPHRFSSAVELAGFIDLTPWHRFGFTAANAAIIKSAALASVVHVVDLGLAHCMQFPTLVDAIAAAAANAGRRPPVLRLTVVPAADHHPPALGLSYHDLGIRLVSFARSRGLSLDFRVVESSHADGFASLLRHLHAEAAARDGFTSSSSEQDQEQQQQQQEQQGEEALVINCHMRLHCIPEENLRTLFLRAIRALSPTAVVLVEEDADLTSDNLVSRVRSAFNYMWIPYDTAESTFLAGRGSEQRRWYESDICWRIHNVVASEGDQRVERLEPKSKWAHRMRAASFRGVGFGDEAVAEVKAMLDEHAAGWGVKKDDLGDLLLTWKGHNVVFATLWLPSA